MKRSDYLIASLLLFFALFIWLRDTGWMKSWDDTLPILVTLPLCFWLGSPWTFREEDKAISSLLLLFSGAAFAIGMAANITFILGLSWTLLLWAWLKKKLRDDRVVEVRKLLILLLMAFPWIALDAERIGWYFRLSAASVAENFFMLTSYPVERQGTLLLVNAIPISVEAACSGLNTLQSLLISGTACAYILLSKTSRYWWNIPLLVLMAWMANCIRIITICLAAVLVNPKFAMGTFHDMGGWVVIILMFGLCWLLFSLQEPKNLKGSND